MESNVFTPPRASGVSRRNTIGTAGSPFNYRRPRALQSTPLGNVSNVRNLNDSSFTAGPAVVHARPAPVLEISDCSTIPPVGDMLEHKFAAERDRRPLIFAKDNVENYGERKDLFGNKDMNMSLNSSRFDASRNPLKRITPPSTDFLESQVDDQETQPALLFSNVSKRVITPITEKEEDKPASGTRKGPPLRSLHTFEPVIKRARTITSHDIQKDSTSKTPEQDYWVTVFGFDKAQLPDVLDLFGRHGNIVKNETPEEGNWVHIRYGSVTHAQQAIARNGQLLDKTMIGVVPSTKPNGTQSFQITPKIPGHNEKLAEAFGVSMSNSLSDSIRIEKGTYTGMRACAAPGFKFTEPKPNESIMSKIISVFK